MTKEKMAHLLWSPQELEMHCAELQPVDARGRMFSAKGKTYPLVSFAAKDARLWVAKQMNAKKIDGAIKKRLGM
jgi:hypothetical protein